jgi:heme/copper-type cytochrome/quinol oxidase subunit 2
MKLLAIILVLATLAACSQAPSGNIATPTTPEVTVAGNVVELNLTAKDFEFSQKEIRVRQGDRVILHVTATDGDHGVGIQGYTESIQVNEGETKTLEFVADKAGNFTYYCNVPCGSGHRNMKGMLIVE